MYCLLRLIDAIRFKNIILVVKTENENEESTKEKKNVKHSENNIKSFTCSFIRYAFGIL